MKVQEFRVVSVSLPRDFLEGRNNMRLVLNLSQIKASGREYRYNISVIRCEANGDWVTMSEGLKGSHSAKGGWIPFQFPSKVCTRDEVDAIEMLLKTLTVPLDAAWAFSYIKYVKKLASWIKEDIRLWDENFDPTQDYDLDDRVLSAIL
jgi:hypothetical protein